MALVFRTLIVDDANVALARQLAATLAGPAGGGMFTTPLSAGGTGPATHWISTGWIEDSFANLMPLQAWVASDEFPGQQEVIDVSDGQPEVVVALAAEAGVEVTLAEVQDLFYAADITEQEWPVACERLGLKMVQPDETPAG